MFLQIARYFGRYVATIGLPYVWAQRLAGMDFLSVVRPKLAAPSTSEAGRDAEGEEDGEEDEVVVKVAADTGVAHMQMENTVKGIRARLMARLALQKQVGWQFCLAHFHDIKYKSI